MSAYYRIKIYFKSQSEVIISNPWLFKVGFEFEKSLKKTLIIAYIFNVPAWCTSNYFRHIIVSIMDISCFWSILSSGWCQPHKIHMIQEEKMHCLSAPPSVQAWISRRRTFVSRSVWKQPLQVIRLAFSHRAQCGKAFNLLALIQLLQQIGVVCL